ncbi:MAG: phosphoglycerate mutase, partial [Paramuribaculum sp.]|nr:phosphoglycerate mutase [Paramuribaculum sp.]
MKTLLVIIDGAADMADEDGATPLRVADMPVADTIARMSATGRLMTAPGTNAPGSETAIMSILGYGNDKPIEGRGWFEA